MCAGRCAAYVSLSQFITPSGLQRIWQTANMVQKLIYFLKLIHPRHLFNDQQLSLQSFTVKSNQSGHNTRSFFLFFYYFWPAKEQRPLRSWTVDEFLLHFTVRAKFLSLPYKKRGCQTSYRTAFRGVFWKSEPKARSLEGWGTENRCF